MSDTSDRVWYLRAKFERLHLKWSPIGATLRKAPAGHKYETNVTVNYSDKHTSLPGLRHKINHSGKFALKVEPHESYTRKALAMIKNTVEVNYSIKHTSLPGLRH